MVQLLAMASRHPVSNLPSYSSPVHLTVSTTSTHPQPDRSRGHQPAGDRARARVVRACAPSKFPARPQADVARHPQLDRAEVNAASRLPQSPPHLVPLLSTLLLPPIIFSASARCSSSEPPPNQGEREQRRESPCLLPSPEQIPGEPAGSCCGRRRAEPASA